MQENTTIKRAKRSAPSQQVTNRHNSISKINTNSKKDPQKKIRLGKVSKKTTGWLNYAWRYQPHPYLWCGSRHIDVWFSCKIPNSSMHYQQLHDMQQHKWSLDVLQKSMPPDHWRQCTAPHDIAEIYTAMDKQRHPAPHPLKTQMATARRKIKRAKRLGEIQSHKEKNSKCLQRRTWQLRQRHPDQR